MYIQKNRIKFANVYTFSYLCNMINQKKTNIRRFTFTEIEFTMILSSIYLTIQQLKREEETTPDPRLSQTISQEIIRYKELQNKLKKNTIKNNDKKTN